MSVPTLTIRTPYSIRHNTEGVVTSPVLSKHNDKATEQYVIVIPYPRGLYGIYCLSPRAKAINYMWHEGVWYNDF